MPYEDFGKLQEYARSRNIIFFATPHTESAFEYLKSINIPCYKVGSGEHDTKFIDKIADTGKPLIVSTGLRTHYEVLSLMDRYGGPDAAFLHCVTMYPGIESLLNLGFIDIMRRYAAVSRSVIGYSDHTDGTLACEIAVSKGAKIIEKHICLEDSEGQDVLVSLKNRKELSGFVNKIRQIESMVGSQFRTYSSEEKENESWALKQTDGRRGI